MGADDRAIGADDEGDAAVEAAIRIVDAVVLAGLVLGEVAEEGEGDAELLGELAGAGPVIDADADDLGVFTGERVDLGLERAHLPCAAAGEGERIEGEHQVFAGEGIERDLLTVAVLQNKIGAVSPVCTVMVSSCSDTASSTMAPPKRGVARACTRPGGRPMFGRRPFTT